MVASAPKPERKASMARVFSPSVRLVKRPRRSTWTPDTVRDGDIVCQMVKTRYPADEQLDALLVGLSEFGYSLELVDLTEEAE